MRQHGALGRLALLPDRLQRGAAGDLLGTEDVGMAVDHLVGDAVGDLIERYTEVLPDVELIGYRHGYHGVLTGSYTVFDEETRKNAGILRNFGGSPIGNSRVKLTNAKDLVRRGLVAEGDDPLKVAADRLVADGVDVLGTGVPPSNCSWREVSHQPSTRPSLGMWRCSTCASALTSCADVPTVRKGSSTRDFHFSSTGPEDTSANSSSARGCWSAAMMLARRTTTCRSARLAQASSSPAGTTAPSS